MRLLKSIVGYVKKRVTILLAKEEEVEQKLLKKFHQKKSQKKFLVGGKDTVKYSTTAEISYRDLRFGLLEMVASFIIGFATAYSSLVLLLLGK